MIVHIPSTEVRLETSTSGFPYCLQTYAKDYYGPGQYKYTPPTEEEIKALKRRDYEIQHPWKAKILRWIFEVLLKEVPVGQTTNNRN